VKKNCIILFSILFVASAISQKPTLIAPSLIQPFSGESNNYPQTTWNQIIGFSDLKITRSGSGESLMGNFVCDAILNRTEADFAFIRIGELYADIFRGVEYDTTRFTGNRLIYVQVGEYPLYPKKEYRVVTIDYHSNGLAGFEMLTKISSKHVFRTGVLLRDTLSDYIQQNSPLDQTRVRLDQRWVKK